MNKKDCTNIFIVEDNKVFTLALKADIESVFKYRNVKIHAFETGEASMKKFKQEDPEIIILDYHLNSNFPEAADGIKILDWIKKENQDTNVIMLTSEDHVDIAARSFKHGASDYVVKTETKFKKINYSLFNMFKIMDAKIEAQKYKRLATALFACIALVVGIVVAIHVFAPGIL